MTGSLTHSPADVVRQLLIDLGHGTIPSGGGSWPVFVSQEPNSPDSVITVYDTTERQDGRTMVDGERQEHEGIQVRIRDPDHAGGYTKAHAIAIALDTFASPTSVTIGSSVYQLWAATRVSGPIALGKETPNSKRNLFTINATVTLRQTT